MATEAFTIVSHYTSNDETSSTVQKEAVLSSELDALWESEAGPSNISLKRRIPPRFVPASNSHSLTDTVTTSKPSSTTEANEIASWYAGLSRSQTASSQPSPGTTAPLAQVTSKSKPSKPAKKDWFIHRALSNIPQDAEPVQHSSIADMLQQTPPSLENPIQPPVFLHIGPNNRGFSLLQRQGWEEGLPLGLNTGRTSVTHVGSAPLAPHHEDSATQSEAGEQTQSAGSKEDTQAPSRTALITPLRTTLKVDKRGIGPRSKSMPKPAVTHSLSDIRTAVERARRERDGRGKRGFARTARRDAEERSRLFQELK